MLFKACITLALVTLFARSAYKLAPFDLAHWVLALAAGSLILVAMEFWKAVRRNPSPG